MSSKKQQDFTVGQVMTPFPYSIDLKDRAATALALMGQHKVRHLPVISEGRLFSVVSEREINLVISMDPQSAESLVVGDVCAIEVYRASTDVPLTEVLDQMTRRHIGSVVVEQDGRLAGIFTSTDACRVLRKMIAGEAIP